MFSRITIAFVGIGSPESFSTNEQYPTTVIEAELNEILGRGAVGDIALRFFDNFGNKIDSDVDRRIIGIDLEQLDRIDKVVGVAGGPLKVDALLGALRGQLLNVLITDHVTALQLLEKAMNKPASIHH
jgi:DNA-binding transcriptional regulator LsrR (DeoR family)